MGSNFGLFENVPLDDFHLGDFPQNDYHDYFDYPYFDPY
jgi:hypothetical protein